MRIAAAFGGQPEAAFAIDHDAFKIEQLGRLAAPRDGQSSGDPGRLFVCINGEDAGLAGINGIADAIENARLFRVGGQAGHGAPAKGCVLFIAARDDGGIGGHTFRVAVQGHVGTNAAVLAKISFIGHGQKDCATELR